MSSRIAAGVVACALAGACGHAQAVRARDAAQIATASALAVMLASILAKAAAPSHGELTDLGYAMVPVSIAGAALYIAEDSIAGKTEPAPPPSAFGPQPSELANDRARELAVQAATAARTGDCEQVHALEAQIAQLDLRVFAMSTRYQVIRDCLDETEHERAKP